MTLLLKAATSFWDVNHSLTGVVGFSHLYSTEFYTLSSIDSGRLLPLLSNKYSYSHQSEEGSQENDRVMTTGVKDQLLDQEI